MKLKRRGMQDLALIEFKESSKGQSKKLGSSGKGGGIGTSPITQQAILTKEHREGKKG